MSATTSQPTNMNFLSPINFRVQVEKMPLLSHYVQSVNIPGISLGDSSIPTPFVSLPRAGDHLIYEDLTLTFKCSENMKNYVELYQWMTGLGFPDSFEQFTPYRKAEYSDISVVIFSSSKNPIHEFVFKDCYPNFMSGFPMSAIAVDVDYVDITCNFKYRVFTVKVPT